MEGRPGRPACRRAFVLVPLMWLLLFCLPGAAGRRASAAPPDFAVALDVGHDIVDSGARSARGVAEYDFNRRLATEVREALLSAGFTKAFLINGAGGSHGERGLRERAAAAGKAGADLLISIHHDSVKEKYLKAWTFEGHDARYCDSFSGYSLFYSPKSGHGERSLRFAEILGEELLAGGFHPSLHHAPGVAGENLALADRQRGIYAANFTVIEAARGPAVLFEAGIIVNRDEEAALSQPQYRAGMAKAVARAVSRFAREPR
jgi:N-acetylmuramoyl-L-alanine amidase